MHINYTRVVNVHQVHKKTFVFIMLRLYLQLLGRGVTRGAQLLGRRITTGMPKSLNNVTSTFFNTAHLLPKKLRFEHGGAKLASCPGRHLTSLRPCFPFHFCCGKN